MIVRRIWPSRPSMDAGFGDLDRLRREFQRLLDSVTDEAPESPATGVFPPVNVTQDDNNFYLRADIPGIKASELAITAVRNRVSLAGKRELPKEHEHASYHRRERGEGAFNRAVTLPSEVDTARVDARYTDGVLLLTLPKSEALKPRQITVKT